MKRLLAISLINVFLMACGNSYLDGEQEGDGQTIALNQEKRLSWEEKIIAEIVKYEGWTEKNSDLSMERLIAKKEACIEYANQTYGEGFEIMGDGTRIMNDHRYSPRFDRCLTKRQFRDYGDLGLPPETTIIDVVSEKILFSRYDDCESNLDISRYAVQESRDICPSVLDMMRLWDALITTSP